MRSGPRVCVTVCVSTLLKNVCYKSLPETALGSPVGRSFLSANTSIKIAPNGGIRPQTNPTTERNIGDVLLRLPKK